MAQAVRARKGFEAPTTDHGMLKGAGPAGGRSGTRLS